MHKTYINLTTQPVGNIADFTFINNLPSMLGDEIHAAIAETDRQSYPRLLHLLESMKATGVVLHKDTTPQAVLDKFKKLDSYAGRSTYILLSD